MLGREKMRGVSLAQRDKSVRECYPSEVVINEIAINQRDGCRLLDHLVQLQDASTEHLMHQRLYHRNAL